MCGNFRKNVILSLVLSAAIFSMPEFASGQSEPAKDNQKKKADSINAEVDMTRWRGMLDQLIEQARSISQETIRPQLMAEVASAYWVLDKDRSGELFMSALESALDLKGNSNESNAAVRQVILLAAKCDAALTKRLTDRLMELRAKDPRATGASIEAAIDLLNSDAKAAAQLAAASAPAGLSSDAAGAFILQLAQQDLTGAEKVYRAYLTKLTANQVVPLGQLLWLAGYPLGYGETYGFAGNNPARIIGFGGRQITGLAPNAALAKAFLGLAFQSVRRTLEVAATEPPPRAELISGRALFAISYLSPEIARYRPEMAAQWQLFYQQAKSGTPPGLQQEISGQINLILNNRAIAEKRALSKEFHDNEMIQAALDQAEKLPEGCQRDRAYAQAALTIGSTKDYSRALAMMERIKDITLRDSVRQFIQYDMASAAVERGDLDEAQTYIKRVETRDQRTLLYVKIAGAALRKKDQVLAGQLLAEMRRMADSISDRGAQAAVLLASAAVGAQFDPLIANGTLKDAINAINQSGSRNVDSFSVTRKVRLDCPGDKQEQWYGSQDQAEQFSLLETLASLSKNDIDGYILMAQGIEDPATRIRAQLVIARTVMKK
jgi:soluble cytochrome b562